MSDLTDHEIPVPPPLDAPAELTLVTGASGWFGRAYLHALSGGSDADFARPGRIRVLVPVPEDVALVLEVAPKAEIVVGDVTDPDSVAHLMKGAEGASLVHAAGVIHPATYDDFERVNVGGTRAVLDAAIAAGVRRMVHVSSNSPFGTNPTTDDVFRNDEPYRPYLGYGTSKMHGEMLVRQAHDRGDLATVVLRPPWFYGPWQPLRQTTFFRLCRTGKFPQLGDARQRRSMTYTDNLVQGVVLAENSPAAPGKAYWVADGKPYEVNEIVSTVRRVLSEEGYQLSKKTMRMPSVLGDLAEKIDTGLQKRGRYKQEFHVLGEMNKTIACDISAIKADLGFEPRVDLYEGMRRSVAWCRERGVEI
jgi:nucleoside-diphosphate-sugar epimerase